LAGLLARGPFPVDMIGPAEGIGNTTPPSIALLAFAAAQTGLVLAAEPAVSRLLGRPGRWRLVTRLNSCVMTVYLWHMVPAIIVAVALYPTGVMPQPASGSAQWWETTAGLARRPRADPGAAGPGGHAGGTADAPVACRAWTSRPLVRV